MANPNNPKDKIPGADPSPAPQQDPSPQQDPAPEGNENYIKTIREMKKNMVDRSEFDKLQKENTALLQALADGGQIDLAEEEEEAAPDVKELRNKLFSMDEDLTNMEYVETALKLRKALMDSGEADPFLPIGSSREVSNRELESEQEAADRVAEGLQHCLDYAEGDSSIFTSELSRIIREDSGATRMNAARNNARRR